MLTANGQLDSTFGHKGITHTDNYVFVYGAFDSEEEQIEDRQLIPLSKGRFLYLRSDYDSGNTYQNGEGEGFEFDHKYVLVDVYRRDGSIDPSFQFDRTNVLSGTDDERSGTLVFGVTAMKHDATVFFLQTDDAGHEPFDQNDHLFMISMGADGAVKETSIAEHSFALIAFVQTDGAFVLDRGRAAGLVQYAAGGGEGKAFVTDRTLIKRSATLAALKSSDDGEVLAFFDRRMDGPSGSMTSSFLAKLQTGDAPAGVFAGSNIHSDRTGYRFTITWADDGNVQASSLDSTDVLVVAPNGSEIGAKLLSLEPTDDSGVIEATYRAIGPGGSWDSADNGTYFIRVRSNHVFDTEGHAAAGRLVGRFGVRIPAHV